AWEVAYLFPAQGTWTECEYLGLPGNRLIELSDGFLEILPMPTMSHQMIIAAFYEALVAFVRPGKLGTVLFTGLRVGRWKGKIRVDCPPAGNAAPGLPAGPAHEHPFALALLARAVTIALAQNGPSARRIAMPHNPFPDLAPLYLAQAALTVWMLVDAYRRGVD